MIKLPLLGSTGVSEAAPGVLENCEKTVMNIIRTSLDLDQSMLIDSAYRPAQRGNSSRPRVIVVKFHHNHKQRVVSQALLDPEKQKALTNMGVGIGTQLPRGSCRP